MASTFNKLDSVTVGAGGVASISFTNIPSGYVDLVIKTSARTTGTNGTFFFNLNGVQTGSFAIRLASFHGVNSGGSGFPNSYWSYGNPSNTLTGVFDNDEVYLPGYVNNTSFKTVAGNTVYLDNSTSWGVISTAGQKTNTEAVTSITIAPVIDPLIAQHSTFTLYGVYNSPLETRVEAPTSVSATAGSRAADIAFTPPASGAPAASFVATSTPGNFSNVGTATMQVGGLTAGTAYTFAVAGQNPGGLGASVTTNSVTPYDGFESIATVSGASATLSFTSIPSDFTHLQIRGYTRDTRAVGLDNFYIQFNGDSGANYSWHYLQSDLSSIYSSGSSATSDILVGTCPSGSTNANMMGVLVADILDYSNTNKFKTVRSLTVANTNGTFNGQCTLCSGNWRSNAAVTSITLVPGGGTFGANAKFELYGMRG